MSDNDDGDFDNALLESINRLEQRQRDGSDTAGSMNQSQSTGDIANALQNLDGNCASSSTTAAGAAGSGSKRQRSHDELQRQPNLEKKTKIENANDFCLQVPTQAHFAEACQCVLNVLSKWFQHDSFRQQQWKIIASTLMGHDGVAVLATGSGKSLTYQFPAVFLRAVSQGMVPGACGKDRSNCWVSIMQQRGKKHAFGRTTVVVSPLLSLMYDQMTALKRKGISVCLLSGEQKDMRVFEEATNGEYSIVYVTPELAVSGWSAKLKKMNDSGIVCLVAIDESHCVSEWGHDFRPSYRSLGMIKELLGRSAHSPPMLALTATATKATVKDVSRILQLEKAFLHKFSVDRPNLYYSFQCRVSDEIDLVKAIFYSTDENQNGKAVPTIIYCRTKAETERLASLIQTKFKVKASPFHAGLPVKQKNRIHDDFMSDKTLVICATIAFGMGVDKPNIRVIVHWGLPNSAEAFLQHCGRAGRDGEHSRCILFWSSADFSQMERMIHYSSGSAKHKDSQLEKYQEMVDIVTSPPTACKRQLLLKKFEEEVTPSDMCYKCCNGCDERIKRGGENETFSSSATRNTLTEKQLKRLETDCKYLCEAVSQVNSKGGLSLVLQLLMGSKSEKLLKSFPVHRLRTVKVYGKGSGKSKEYWQAVSRFCMRIGLISTSTKELKGNFKKTFSFTTYYLTPKGNQLIQSSWSLPLDVDVPVDLSRNGNFQSSSSKPGNRSLVSLNEVLTARTTGHSQNVASSSDTGSKRAHRSSAATKHIDVLNKLYTCRKEIARKHGLKPFMVVSKNTLEELSVRRPSTEEELSRIDGMFGATVKQFGEELLQGIQEAVGGKSEIVTS